MPEYRLLREHRINKVLQPAGAIVTLPEQTGEWLKTQGVTEPVDALPPRTASAPVAPASALRAQVAPSKVRFKCCGW